MTGPIFVDTNVLVYVRDRTDEVKQRLAAEWMAVVWDLRLGRVSYQVLQEYYVTATKKLDPPRSVHDVREDVTALRSWAPVVTDYPVMERAWQVQDRYGLSWWDSLIVGAALVAECAYLLTEDLQDGQEIDGLTVIDPFRHSAEEVLDR